MCESIFVCGYTHASVRRCAHHPVHIPHGGVCVCVCVCLCVYLCVCLTSKYYS